MPRKREDIVIRFGGDDTGFQRAAKSVRNTTAKLTKSIGNIAQRFGRAFGIGAGSITGLAIGAIAKITNELDELGKTAKGLNTTVEGLYRLRFAVSQTSQTTERQLSTALQRLIKHIGQANRGIKTSQELFRELGLDWQYLASLNADEAFLEIVDAINQIPNSYKQASLAQKLFEENWRVLMPTLTSSREELEKLIDKQRQIGGPTTEAAEAAAKFNDALGEFGQHLTNIGYTLTPVIEGINNFFDAFKKSQTVEKVNEDIAQTVVSIAELQDRLADTSWAGKFDRALRGGQLRGTLNVLLKQLDDLQAKKDELLNQEPQTVPKAKAWHGPSPEEKPTIGTKQEVEEDPFLAYKRGEITRSEWLQRWDDARREANPYYKRTKAPLPQASFSSVQPEEVAQAIAESTASALSARTYQINVEPILIGAEGIESVAQDHADKEGPHE